jgi:hypothetical protein
VRLGPTDETFGLAQFAVSFDHLVGARKQHGRNIEAKRPGGVEIDHQLEFGRLLHRQISGLLAPEYPIDIRRCSLELIDDVRAVGNEAARSGVKPEWIDRGQSIASRQVDDQLVI